MALKSLVGNFFTDLMMAVRGRNGENHQIHHRLEKLKMTADRSSLVVSHQAI